MNPLDWRYVTTSIGVTVVLVLVISLPLTMLTDWVPGIAVGVGGLVGGAVAQVITHWFWSRRGRSQSSPENHNWREDTTR